MQLKRRLSSGFKAELLSHLSSADVPLVEFRSALAFLRQRGLLTQPREYTIVVSALGQRGLWQDVLAMLDDMQLRVVPTTPILRNAVISAFGSAGKWELSLHLLSPILARSVGQHEAEDRVAYNSAITACSMGSAWQLAAFSLPSEMRRATLRPDVVTFGAIMTACERGRAWSSVLQSLTDLRSCTLAPNDVICSTALTACQTSLRWEGALWVLRDCLQASVQPGSLAYITVSATCGRSRQSEHALQIMQEMRQSTLQMSLSAYNVAFAACKSSALWDQALALLRDLSGVSLQPDADALLSIATSCERARRPTLATWLQSMARRQVAVQLLKQPVFSIAQHTREGPQDSELLHAILRQDVDPRYATTLCNERIGEHSNSGRHADILALLADMRRVAIEPSMVTYSLAVHACESLGRQGDLRKMLRGVLQCAVWLLHSRDDTWHFRDMFADHAGAAMVALDILHGHQHLPPPIAQAFRCCLARSVIDAFYRCIDEPLPGIGGGRGGSGTPWRLQSMVLERQFSFGKFLTADTFQQLALVLPSPGGCFRRRKSRVAPAPEQSGCRQGEHQHPK